MLSAAQALALLEAAVDPVVARDREGCVLLWSRGAALMYGWRSDEALGQPLHTLLRTEFPDCPPGQDGYAWAMAEFGRAGVWEGEVLQYGRDGTGRLVETRWVHAGPQAGATAGTTVGRGAPGPWDGPVLEIGRDVTLRRRATAALANLAAAVAGGGDAPPWVAREALEAQERYRSIFENAIEGIFFTTPDQREVRVNPAMARIFGFDSPEDLMASSTDLRELLGAPSRAQIQSLIGERGPIRGLEIEGRRKDGSTVWVSLDVVPVNDGRGKFVGYQGLVVDVSHRREVAESLRRATEEAERANLAKTDFLSRTSHELRTPLAATLGFAQLLQREATTEAQSEYVGHILTASRHLLDLINEVLEIARIEQGRLGLSLEPVRVADVVAECLELIQPQAEERSITVHASPESCPGHVQADRQRLLQVLLNLLSNAVKYNRVAGSVTVGCEAVEGGRLRISVSDTGLGIPPEKQALAFAPFERLGAERAGVEGTGLGLALSQGLVEAMGGSLGMESLPGQGSTFWILLPATPAPVDLGALAGARDEAQPHASGPGQSAVLYIEDNASNMRLMEHLISYRTGTVLLPADRGATGLQLAREHQPGLVLLDLNLPDMAGLDVLRQLRADPRTAGIPVVVLSADATYQSMQRLLDAGANAYLTKPFELDDFLAMLDRLLGSRRVPSEEDDAVGD